VPVGSGANIDSEVEPSLEISLGSSTSAAAATSAALVPRVVKYGDCFCRPVFLVKNRRPPSRHGSETRG
jgi:hypothetical protein